MDRLSTSTLHGRDRCQRPGCALFHDAPLPAAHPSEVERARVSTQVWTEGDLLYEEMVGAIGRARRSVRFESFIFADDIVGQRLAQALAERAGAGIVVRVHIDALRVLIDRNQKLINRLRSAGVQLKLFGELRLSRPRAFLRRNHRKLLVVDEQQAFLGGFNIHRQSSRNAVGVCRWRDTHVKLSGPIAKVAAQIFDTMWNGDPAASFSGCARVADGEMLVADSSRDCRHRLRCLLAAAFAQARRCLYLTTPYFVPPQEIETALADAARRGVDVRLLLPQRSNHAFALAAGQARYGVLLRSGVRIFEYLPRLLHAKTVVVDSQWCTVGTANIDYLSLFANHELNVVSNEAALAHRIEQDFLSDLRDSRELARDTWETRPASARAAEWAAWSMRHWL